MDWKTATQSISFRWHTSYMQLAISYNKIASVTASKYADELIPTK